MQNLFDLTDRVAIVTGGGRGIGREIARTLAQAGAHIAVADYIAENGTEAAEEVRGMGREALAVQTDVRDSASVETMAQQVENQFGRIDILVNNAGIAQHKPAEDITDEEWLNMMAVNLNGVFWCCRAVGRRMLARGSGSIVSIASMSGHIANKPQPQSHYNTAKAAVIMLTKSLAFEWAERGVRVNSVSPGYIGTEMTKSSLSRPELSSVWLEMTPMKRVGEPRDIAHAVWYLASDAASFATGTDLIVDGGYTVL
jgi:NAD(P)-dependent dehydrogenase (short-subunit alcohol dehydrogenase family)